MQTFLPYADYDESARVIDDKRLQKQTVETYQILLQLCDFTPVKGGPLDKAGKPTITEGFRPPERRYNKDGSMRTPGWGNHPMLRMWRGYELSLVDYQHACFRELIKRPLKSGNDRKVTVWGLTDWLIETAREHGATFDPSPPPWLGDEPLHASHRASLLWKAPEWYSQFGWTEHPEYAYVWPVD